LNKKNSDFNVGALSEALALTSKNATTKEEKKILNGIVNFGNTETSEVMCPRMDIFAISREDEYAEVLKKIIDNGHSRVPVYEENLDNIVGVLYIKDLIPHLNKKTFNWQALIRKPFFIPENKKLDDLLKEFQELKNHLAIVVDEYGGTSGIISLEDVIEEIVGDISDEFDEQDLLFTKIDELNFLFEGKISIKDFFKITKIDQYHFEPFIYEAETLAGMLLEITGRYPKLQEKISVGNFLFSIESIDNKRIKQIKLTLPAEKNK
jgi:gliding motility-associated protein GldE